MKQLIIIILLLILVSCNSTFKVVEHPTDYSTVLKKRRVTAVLFKENASCFFCLQDKNRFTPTIAEIEKAEKILKEKLYEANKSRINQSGKCPTIHKNLKSYRRQYFGYFDNNGHKIIYVTFNWDRYSILDRIRGYSKNENENWKSERQIVMDGCSNHWEIKINLDKEQLFELGINGIA